LKNPELENTFIEKASSEGLEYLKGHRTVGGMRASIYNPMKMDSILALKEFMVNFEKKYG
jgi:phosphoserine aminotransferase